MRKGIAYEELHDTDPFSLMSWSGMDHRSNPRQDLLVLSYEDLIKPFQ